jgi:hypothetical protein
MKAVGSRATAKLGTSFIDMVVQGMRSAGRQS